MKKLVTKHNSFIGIISFILFLLTSCEKVVQLDLSSADQQVVVQANVFNRPGPYIVNLNYSISYYSDNTFPNVTGASVQLSDDAGNSETLSEVSPGIYKTNVISGTAGRTYYLQINANNNYYSAFSTMPNPVAIDSLLLTPIYSKNTTIITGYRAICKYTDPAGVGNFYRVVVGSNNLSALGDRTSRVVEDKVVDGQQLSSSFSTKLHTGDTINMQLQCIDKSTYDFYNTLNNAIGNTGAGQFISSLPANPTNNISNHGLGYFSAYALTTKTLVIP